MPVCTADFELGTDGSDILLSDPGSASPWYTKVGGAGPSTVKYDSTYQLHGELAARFDSGPNSQPIYLEWDPTYGTHVEDYGRMYLYFTAYPSSGSVYVCFCCPINELGQVLYQLRIDSAGKLVISNASTIVDTSVPSISLNTLVRVEYHYILSTSGAGSIEAKLFNTAESNTPDDTLIATGLTNLGGTATKIDLGRVLQGGIQNNYVFYMDDILVGATAYPGPTASDPLKSPVSTQKEFASSKIGPF